MPGGTSDKENSLDERGENVLRPSDLDIADSEYVAELEKGRYVVSTDNSAPEPNDSPIPRTERSALDPETASYAVDIEVSVEGRVSSYRTASDDIVATFSDLVRWYATQVDDDLDPSRVLQILIAESELSIGPYHTVETALDRYELTPSDSIADLLYALETHR